MATTTATFTKTINDTDQTDVCTVTIPNSDGASIFVRYSANLDDGTKVHRATGNGVLNIEVDADGVAATQLSLESSTAVRASEPSIAGGFVLACASYSTTSPVEIVIFASGYGGDSPATGDVVIEITDLRGHVITEL